MKKTVKAVQTLLVEMYTKTGLKDWMGDGCSLFRTM